MYFRFRSKGLFIWALFNRTGSVFEISPCHSFLAKNFDVFVWKAGGLAWLPRSRVCDWDLVTGMKIFPCKHSSPGNRNEPFQTKTASLSHHSGRNGIIFCVVCLVCISILGVCELSLLVKLQEFTTLRQPRIIQVYVSPFWSCFLDFIPVDQAETSHMNRQQNSAR